MFLLVQPLIRKTQGEHCLANAVPPPSGLTLSKIAFHSSNHITLLAKSHPPVTFADNFVHGHPTVPRNIRNSQFIERQNIRVKTGPANIINVHVDVDGDSLADAEESNDIVVEAVDDGRPLIATKDSTEGFDIWPFEEVWTGRYSWL